MSYSHKSEKERKDDDKETQSYRQLVQEDRNERLVEHSMNSDRGRDQEHIAKKTENMRKDKGLLGKWKGNWKQQC